MSQKWKNDIAVSYQGLMSLLTILVAISVRKFVSFFDWHFCFVCLNFFFLYFRVFAVVHLPPFLLRKNYLQEVILTIIQSFPAKILIVMSPFLMILPSL